MCKFSMNVDCELATRQFGMDSSLLEQMTKCPSGYVTLFPKVFFRKSFAIRAPCLTSSSIGCKSFDERFQYLLILDELRQIHPQQWRYL
jgi:hypothetical protein